MSYDNVDSDVLLDYANEDTFESHDTMSEDEEWEHSDYSSGNDTVLYMFDFNDVDDVTLDDY